MGARTLIFVLVVSSMIAMACSGESDDDGRDTRVDAPSIDLNSDSEADTPDGPDASVNDMADDVSDAADNDTRMAADNDTRMADAADNDTSVADAADDDTRAVDVGGDQQSTTDVTDIAALDTAVDDASDASDASDDDTRVVDVGDDQQSPIDVTDIAALDTAVNDTSGDDTRVVDVGDDQHAPTDVTDDVDEMLDAADVLAADADLGSTDITDPDGDVGDVGAQDAADVALVDAGDMSGGDTTTPTTVLFSEDFENGFASWFVEGLWNLEADHHTCGIMIAPFPSTQFAAYFGQDGDCTYDIGTESSGNLTLVAPLALPSDATLELNFWSYEESEHLGNCTDWADRRLVQLSTDGVNWHTLAEPCTEGSWYEEKVDLTAYAGEHVVIRFRFDSVDSFSNDYFGWLVDDIEVVCTGVTCSP